MGLVVSSVLSVQFIVIQRMSFHSFRLMMWLERFTRAICRRVEDVSCVQSNVVLKTFHKVVLVV